MRRAYHRGRLDETTVPDSWLAQFQAWFAEAAADPAVVEPNAMQLATVDGSGRPSVRTVLLKGLDERGLVFYTNYDSAKGRDLAMHPYGAVVFTWQAHERQVRLSGPVSRVERADSEAYFAGRPRGSQLAALISPQSQPVDSRAVLEQAVLDAARQFEGHPVPTPQNWGGYRLAPEVVEFWQGGADRLHDRVRMRRDEERWIVERLAP